MLTFPFSKANFSNCQKEVIILSWISSMDTLCAHKNGKNNELIFVQCQFRNVILTHDFRSGILFPPSGCENPALGPKAPAGFSPPRAEIFMPDRKSWVTMSQCSNEGSSLYPVKSCGRDSNETRKLIFAQKSSSKREREREREREKSIHCD